MKPSAGRVLAVLRDRPGGLTALEALLDAGCGDSLAQRVHELKAEGHAFAESWESTPNGARVKRWRLIRPTAAEPMRGTQEALALA